MLMLHSVRHAFSPSNTADRAWGFANTPQAGSAARRRGSAENTRSIGDLVAHYHLRFWFGARRSENLDSGQQKAKIMVVNLNCIVFGLCEYEL